MAKLTDGHREQCKSMFEDGKRPCEIIKFFKETYRINLKSPTLSYILHGRKKEGVASSEKGRRKVAKKRGLKQAAPPIPTETPDEFVSHVRAAFDIYKQGFLKKVESVVSVT